MLLNLTFSNLISWYIIIITVIIHTLWTIIFSSEVFSWMNFLVEVLYFLKNIPKLILTYTILS